MANNLNQKKPVEINTNRLFLLNLPHFIKFLFTGQVLPILIVFSMLFVFIYLNALMYFVVILMVYKFAFDVLIDSARGDMSPNVRMNYFVTNVVGIKLLAMALLFEIGLMILEKNHVSESYVYSFIVLSTIITPAIFMILSITNSIISSLNPLKIFEIIKTSHLSYGLFVLFWLATEILFEHVLGPIFIKILPVYIDGVVSSFFNYAIIVLNFHIMGYILFQNRHAFDLEEVGFSKVDSDVVTIHTADTNPIYLRIKGLLADDDHEQALAMILELQGNGDRSHELQELSKQAMKMKLYTPSNIEIGQKVHRRLNIGQTKRAFDMVTDHIDSDEKYIETLPEDINQLVVHAIQANKPQYIPHLVKDFHIKYPYHADLVPNYFLLAKQLYNDRATRDKSKMMLVGLIKKHPQDPYMPEIKSWLKGLEMMANR